MAYIHLVDLAQSPGASELSRVVSNEHEALIPAARLDKLLREGGPFSDDPVRALSESDALARIAEAVTGAGGIIDGFLSRRYKLPLSRNIPIVKEWARSITRYLLHKDRKALEKDDPIVRAYYDALKLLQLTAEKKFSLGIDDPETTGGSSVDVRFTGDENVFSREQLKSFR